MDFKVNRIALAEKFCENLEVDTSCQGTCHLIKEIKKDSPEEKKSPFTASDSSKLELLFFENSTSNQSPSLHIKSQFLNVLASSSDSDPKGVFHPPKSLFL